jgi:hypothetical protein
MCPGERAIDERVAYGIVHELGRFTEFQVLELRADCLGFGQGRDPVLLGVIRRQYPGHVRDLAVGHQCPTHRCRLAS